MAFFFAQTEKFQAGDFSNLTNKVDIHFQVMGRPSKRMFTRRLTGASSWGLAFAISPT
jgi:hypothetical protein